MYSEINTIFILKNRKSNKHHPISRLTSTAELKPPTGSCDFHQVTADLVGGLPTLRFPVRGRYCNTFRPHLSPVCPASNVPRPCPTDSLVPSTSATSVSSVAPVMVSANFSASSRSRLWYSSNCSRRLWFSCS